jgi:type II secretory pathway component GspD/PulD (secretin)
VALLLGIKSGQALAGPLTPGDNPATVRTSSTAVNAQAVAKSKLQQARAQLSQGNFDAAEALVQEVARMKLAYRPDADCPAKVMHDIAAARSDATMLLTAARSSLARKQFDQAEKYARLADKYSSVWTFPIWSDSPAKALRDIAAAKKAAGVRTAKTTPPATGPAPARPAPPRPAPTTGDTEKARAQLAQGRKALKAGKLEEAQKCATQARALKANLGYWEDNPDRLEADVRTAMAARKPGAPAATTTVKAPSNGLVPRTKAEAKTLLEQGRAQLNKGNFDEASRTVQRVKALTTASWGLFEDSPDRLQIDIEKARVKRDREESVHVLADGRKLYEKGDYDGAKRLAFKAQKLHGPYSIWDLGDRPSKLLSDVQTAQAKARKTALPPPAIVKKDTPPAPAAIVKKDTPAVPVKNPVAGGTAVASVNPTQPGALPAGVTPDAKPDNSPMATTPSTPPPPPASLVAQAAQTSSAEVKTDPPGSSPNKLRAQQLVAEAQRFRREGKLIEARQKAVEATRLGVVFGPDEVSPELVYQQINLQVRQRIDGLVRQAHETASYGKGDPQSRYREAEGQLNEARDLARTFGQDMQPINARLAELRTMQSGPAPQPVPGTSATGIAQVGHDVPAAPAPAKPSEGQMLLEKARLELKRGETATARRMTESAITTDPTVKDDAVALLRTIDSEEFNQKVLQANRGFDAVLSAYLRREYAQAVALLAAIDERLLDSARKVRLREISMTPEMVAITARTTEKVADKVPAGPLVPVGATVPAGRESTSGHARAEDVGKARATDAADGGLLDHHKQMQVVLMGQLRQQGLEAQREAAQKFRAGQVDQAIVVLEDHLARINDERLDSAQLTQLRRPIESGLNHYRLLKSQRDLRSGILNSRKIGQEAVDAKHRAEENKRKNVERLMKEFNVKFKEGKYLEAESLAMKANELDPDNGVAAAAIYMARRQRDVKEYRDIKDRREGTTLHTLNESEDEGPPNIANDRVNYDKERWDRASQRKPLTPIIMKRYNEKEKAIERRLSTPISLSFEGAKLREVLDDLRNVHGINIVVDNPALQEAGISIDSPISIKLDQVSLKSALNLLLHDVHLTHVIKDEVLQITTEEQARGKLVPVTYQVADLVIPIENFGDVRNKPAPLYAPTSVATTQGTTPVTTGPFSLSGGAPVGQPSGSSMASAGGSSNGSSSGSGSGSGTVTKTRTSNTVEDQLIKLVTSTISPKSWSDMGGPGTIDYFPLTMALVINQTADIQEQIADLLAALRRLQDQEVAVEVRLVSVSEDFFERVGVNFNLNVQTNNTKFQPSLLNNSFVTDSTNFINGFFPTRGLLGLTPAGSLTSDLNIPIGTQSFFQTVPTFGGYTAGGLTLGLAFLSDIQVFLFMEAVQGDQRSNVMQAPKLTLFNGQTATLNVTTTGSFVQGVNVVSLASGAQLALVPQVQPTNLGVDLTIQAVITADRRFVRLSLAPNLTNELPGPIQTFPLVVPIFTAFDGTQTGQPVVFTQFIQQPNFTTVSVQTTVAVPDGGTVLMGGLKRLSEARSEYGPPILSKIPYINRLFKNVGYGRETESLLIMVTPRIIVQEEEEERQTGFVRPVAGNLP